MIAPMRNAAPVHTQATISGIGDALENLPSFYTRKRDATTDTSDTTDTSVTSDTNLNGNIPGLIGRPIEWIVDDISTIIKQLEGVTKVMLITRSFFPL